MLEIDFFSANFLINTVNVIRWGILCVNIYHLTLLLQNITLKKLKKNEKKSRSISICDTENL